MKKLQLTIPAEPKSYPIFVGRGLIDRLPELTPLDVYTKVLIVTEANVAKLWLSKLDNGIGTSHQVLVLPTGEQAKSIDSLDLIWKKLQDIGADRHSLVIALGGGTIGDTAGFAASTYMRGISLIHIPTTLTSQVDSSIGGKTMINIGGIKNPVGSFWQPKAIVADVETLESLPRRILIEGFGEIIKHGLIYDTDYLKLATSKRPEDFSLEELEEIVAGSCRIKGDVVQKDVHESGLRSILNFGHTIGHAVEAISIDTDKDNHLLHGEAVSIGMVVEAELSYLKGFISEQEVRNIQKWLQSAGLPVTVPAMEVAKILAKLGSDKKNRGGKVLFALLESLGKAVWAQEIDIPDIQSAITKYQEDQK